MVKIDIIVPLTVFNTLKWRRYLVDIYIWYIIIYHYYFKISHWLVIGRPLRFKNWTLLVGPKCHKRGQRNLQLKTRRICIKYFMYKIPIKCDKRLIQTINSYLHFCRLFLKTHNCYLNKLTIQVWRCWLLEIK